MSRFLLAAAALVFVAAPSLNAQARPDFSGRWTLVAERSTPAGTSAFGDAFTIEQSASALTMEMAMTNMRFLSGQAGATSTTAPGGTVKTVFATDGTDHPLEENFAGGSTSGVRLIRTYYAGDRTYRAVWMRNQLIIMVHDTVNFSRTQGTRVTIKRMIRRSFALDKDGSLVAESLIVADPMPEDFFFGAAPEQPAPTPVRSVYRKAQ